MQHMSNIQNSVLESIWFIPQKYNPYGLCISCAGNTFQLVKMPWRVVGSQGSGEDIVVQEE
jgi:hypothetical protein